MLSRSAFGLFPVEVSTYVLWWLPERPQALPNVPPGTGNYQAQRMRVASPALSSVTKQS